MDERTLELQMKQDIESVFTNILKEHNYTFPISAKSRAGAEISDYLEDDFVNYLTIHKHERIYNPLSSPKGKTKNPFDVCFNYRCSDANFDDLIWGDIKATNIFYKDSNPNLGTPEKIIDFIMNGHFYLMFILFKYETTEDNKIRFIQFEDEKYVHCQFLKDINHSVRISPLPQFQVNIHEPEEYRTREEFLELFCTKYHESIERNIEKQQKKKAELNNRFDSMRERLKTYNDKIHNYNS